MKTLNLSLSMTKPLEMKMNKYNVFVNTMMATSLLCSTFIGANLHAKEAKKDNIVVIVLDDTGYSDLGSYGSAIDTSNIDAIATDGAQYANFHSTPTCSPSRAAILTGREPHRVGMGLVSRYDMGKRFPAFRGRISDKAATLAEVLSEQSYGTYAIGKWHLLPPSHMKPSGPFNHWPSGKGFDRFYGFLAGSTDQFKPELVEDNHFVEKNYKPDELLTTDLMNNAISMLHNHVSYSPDRPFFMYISTPGMHAPHQASQRYIDKYKGKFDQGWDQVILERFERQKALGLIPQNAQLPSNDERVKKWNNLSAKEKKAYAKLQEVYAAFLEQTDDELGRFIDELKKTGQYDNTNIVVLSDNGGSQEGDVNGAVNHSSHYSGKHETVDDILSRYDDIGHDGAASNYPLGWATASNTPFRYFKQDTYGGGINVPLIIKPAKSNHFKKGIRHQYHYISDIMPTLLDYVDIEIPSNFNGVEQLPVDGMSMVYTLEDANEKSRRDIQFYRMGHNRGIYHQGWSAASRHVSGEDYDDDVWHLYNIEQDITQSIELSKKYPEKLEELKELWQEEGEKVNGDTMIDPKHPGVIMGTAMKLKKLFSGKPDTVEHVIYPKATFVTEKSSPHIVNKSYVIEADIDIKSLQDNGILYTYGNYDSGLVLYVKKNVAYFEYNYLANVPSIGTRYRIDASQPLTIGKNKVTFQFDKTDHLAGVGKLFINDEIVGSVDMPNTVKMRLAHEGAGVGKKWESPVSPDVADINKFTGTLNKVTITVHRNK